jgi:putative oxidoreductase
MFESAAFRDVWSPRLLSIVRILLGLLYMQHGLSKYFGFPTPSPQNFQAMSLLGLAGIIELVGGFLLALGVYTRWVAFVISGEMAVAFFIVRQRLSTRPLREARTTTCCGCGGALIGIGTVSGIPSDRRKNGRGLCKRIMGRSGCGEADDLKGLAELPA